LVTGGSQGSSVFNIVPQAVSMLPTDLRERLIVTQQVRTEDIDNVATSYNKMGVTARLEPFFADMPVILAASHLVIARAGASTVAELAVAGRPAIFVPLAASLDGDQAQNALQMQQNGAAWVVAEKDFTVPSLSARLAEIMQDPGVLSKAAEAARKSGRADAAGKLADLVVSGMKK
jgi:UDP-N-acetylglucosamine--N-acetylmuramyl-(pentapeptide) pyrophosphoryl-undecaprenol N-acetylglucosamine transferase